ncbi:hypothetical protein BST61_g4428 [Cercospora zeina]
MQLRLLTSSFGLPRRSDAQGSSNTTQPILAEELQSAVPDCARTCLENYIQTQFNKRCRAAKCICTRYSNTTEKYSLGELALRCAKGPSCDGVEISQQAAAIAYNLCSGYQGAAPGLHTTLTVAPSITSTSSATSSAMRNFSLITTSTTSATTTGSSSFATARAAEGASPKDRSGLTSGQAVGIAIGSVSAVILILALVYAIACMRRRKSQKKSSSRHSWDFADEEPADYSHFTRGNVDAGGLPYGRNNGKDVGTSSEKRHTVWPSPFHGGQDSSTQREYGHGWSNTAQTTDALPDSPRSNTSTRTLSQLLPERPRYQPPPPPLKSSAYAKYSAHAPVTKQAKATHEGVAQPALSIQIPQQPVRTPDSQRSADWPLPPPPALQRQGEVACLGTNSGAFSSKTSLLDYYASADSGASPQDLNSSTPIEEAIQVRRPAAAAIGITQSPHQPRAVRDSIASDISRRTSFESTNPDDTTPPEDDDKRLSPVVESPISNIRYPRVPRPSNQAVPRSPDYCGASVRQPQRIDSRAHTAGSQKSTGHAPMLSGGTLASKRRGDTAAQNLEQGLHISNSSYTSTRTNATQGPSEERAHRGQQNPLKGYGRPANPPSAARNPSTAMKEKSPAESLRSPLWEPKMTPSRKGDDLYLSVSVATPQATQFHGVYDGR